MEKVGLYQKGGWSWIFIPLFLMFIGSNIVCGIFMLKYKNPFIAGKETFRVGPITWSVLQLILLYIVLIKLGEMGKSFKEIVGFSTQRLSQDVLMASIIAVINTGIIALFTRTTVHLFFSGSRENGPDFLPMGTYMVDYNWEHNRRPC